MQQRSRHGRVTESRSAAETPREGRAKQRAFCIAALEEGDDLRELHELLRTAGVAVVGQVVQHREKPHPNTYLGPGKLVEVKALAKAADANVIACDDELSPRQERNLEAELGIPVVDRTTVILDIFAGHANSADGKLQVELAQLEYNLARMRGLWTHLERLGGGIGTRGPGESQIETDRRLARDRISALKRRLAHVKGSRETMRAERERTGLPRIAIAGYTNAGKSTLLNRLTGADVGIQDRLFHTLDPTTRVMRLDGRPFLVTDTVGFIRKLPAPARRRVRGDAGGDATRGSHPARRRRLGRGGRDAGDDEGGRGRARGDRRRRAAAAARPQQERRDQPRAARRSCAAATRTACSSRRSRATASTRSPSGSRTTSCAGCSRSTCCVPYAEGGRLAELHEIAGDLERTDTPDGVRVRARVSATVAERFARFAVAANGGGPSA